MDASLIGMGLYTPGEAGLLLGVAPGRIARWLRGHVANGKRHEPLWRPQIVLDGDIGLGFRDLMEVRVAASFIAQGLPPFRLRQAIVLARDAVGEDHPLSTRAFRTDGRSIFLQVAKHDGEAALIDLFSRQYAFRDVVERSLRHVDLDDTGRPALWWPLGRSRWVLVDPARSFGRPIEAETSIPVDALVRAVRAERSVEGAARAWNVPPRAVARALAFQGVMDERKAA